ncbi:TIGR03751 family conjugal transfer lipoprotein [Alicycliphilus denitrificans]|uniref:TIGR03751 family conjugal transfer lipoprotein n=1 Tax=Alicycliphilus denitrificans TaxID=179636 RepID=UPI00384E774A
MSVALLAGCSVTGPRESPLKEVTKDSPTLLDIYRGKNLSGQGQSQASSKETARDRLERDAQARPVAQGDGTTARYWSALEPMQQRFARVANPDLVMVVFPHLARGKYPVPGYVTVFPMFETTEYAMPGEAAEDLLRARAAFGARNAAGEARR